MTEKTVFNLIKREWQYATPFIIDAKAWYPEAHDFALNLSKEYNLTVNQVSGCISALSPLKSWDLNKKLTKDFLKGKERGHFRHQINKARNIKKERDSDVIENILNGYKTRNFFRNIENPSDCNYITIDSHIAKFIGNGERINLTNYRYKIIANSFKKFAKEVNLQPNEVQASIWLLAKERWGNDI